MGGMHNVNCDDVERSQTCNFLHNNESCTGVNRSQMLMTKLTVKVG